MVIPELISLPKFPFSIQKLILIPELTPFLESILIPLREQIPIPRSIPIPEAILIPEPIPESIRLRIQLLPPLVRIVCHNIPELSGIGSSLSISSRSNITILNDTAR